MKKVIRVSLLMMLMLTLVRNVYAKESSIDNDSLELEPIVAVKDQTILDNIPEEISLDNQEEDSFIIEENETKSKAEIALQNKIKEILEDNNPETSEIEYSIENKLDENSIYDFTIHMKDGEEEITKNIKVKYNNTAAKEEDKQKKIDELLGDEKKIELIEYKDFYTQEGMNNPVTILEHLQSLFEDGMIHFYYRSSTTDDLYFSYEENGTVFVFSNGTFYELVPTEWKYMSQISIRQDLEDQYVLEQAQEKVEEEYQKNLPENDFEFREEKNVYSASEEKNYGKIEVKRLAEEELTSYEIQSGQNTTLSKTNPILSVRVAGSIEKIIGVYVNGEKMNEQFFTVGNGGIVSLTEEFLKVLNPGTYNLVVRFSDGDAKTNFTLKSEERVEPQQPVYRRTYTTYTRVVTSGNEEVKEEPKEETTEAQTPLTLEESKDSSKDKTIKRENKETQNKQEQEEKAKITWVPIVLIVVALVVIGGFGFLLYKKSKEEE